MTVDEFVAQSKDKAVDWDGYYSYQCQDLVERYNELVVNAPRLGGNAKDLINNPQPNYYEYKTNYPWYVPPKGAIAIWNAKVGGGFGHSAIVLTADVMRFTSLDQNWNNIKEAKVVSHTYSNVAGFLVPRVSKVSDRYNALLSELRAVLNKYPQM